MAKLLSIEQSAPLIGTTSSPIDVAPTIGRSIKISSDRVKINPTIETEAEATPLSEIGVSDSISKSHKIDETVNVGSSSTESSCWVPSSVLVALTVIVIIVAILLIYMYIQFVERDLAFNVSTLRLIESDDNRLRTLNIAFIIGLVSWIVSMASIIMRIETPYKLAGVQGGKVPRRSSTVERDIQNDIYILLGNLAFFLLAIMSIVYYNNPFFTLLFTLGAIIILFFWRPNMNFYILGIIQVYLIVVFAMKFMVVKEDPRIIEQQL